MCLIYPRCNFTDGCTGAHGGGNQAILNLQSIPAQLFKCIHLCIPLKSNRSHMVQMVHVVKMPQFYFNCISNHTRWILLGINARWGKMVHYNEEALPTPWSIKKYRSCYRGEICGTMVALCKRRVWPTPTWMELNSFLGPTRISNRWRYQTSQRVSGPISSMWWVLIRWCSAGPHYTPDLFHSEKRRKTPFLTQNSDVAYQVVAEAYFW